MLSIPVAVLAGALTTIAGMGGGTLLLLFLVATGHDPLQSLAATSVGLLAGNLHRARMYRGHIDRRVAKSLMIGGLPAAILGAFVATELPAEALRVGIAAIGLAGVLLAATGVRIHPPQVGLSIAGATVGGISSTTGGGGLLAGPFLLATGLTGRAYVSTGACLAAAVHVGRLIGYGGGEGIPMETLGMGLAYVAAIPLGNVLGNRLRPYLPTSSTRPIELGTAAVMAGLAMMGAS